MSLQPLNDPLKEQESLLWPVGEFDHNDFQDVLLSKKFLKNAGYLKEPKGGFSVYFDGDADASLRAFQRQNDLAPDGRMTPQGPSFPKLASAANSNAVQKEKVAADGTPSRRETPDAVAEAQKFYDQRGPLGPDGRPLTADPKDFRFGNSGAVESGALSGDKKTDATLMWTLANTGINPQTGEFDYYGNIDGFERDSRTGRWRKTEDKGENPTEQKKPRVISPPPAPPNLGKRKGEKTGLAEWAAWAAEMALWIRQFLGDDEKPESMRP